MILTKKGKQSIQNKDYKGLGHRFRLENFEEALHLCFAIII